MKTTLIRRQPQNEKDPKNENNPKYENNSKNEEDPQIKDRPHSGMWCGVCASRLSSIIVNFCHTQNEVEFCQNSKYVIRQHRTRQDVAQEDSKYEDILLTLTINAHWDFSP